MRKRRNVKIASNRRRSRNNDELASRRGHAWA